MVFHAPGSIAGQAIQRATHNLARVSAVRDTAYSNYVAVTWVLFLLLLMLLMLPSWFLLLLLPLLAHGGQGHNHTQNNKKWTVWGCVRRYSVEVSLRMPGGSAPECSSKYQTELASVLLIVL